MAPRSGSPVVCAACGWQGHRTYAPLDAFVGGRSDRRDGFGTCPTCAEALKPRPIQAARLQKRDEAAKAQLRQNGMA